MKTESQVHLLRIYVNESDRWEGRPLYEMIIRAAKERGLSGATALRGIEGFGISGRVHSVKVLHLSEDVPIVVEILDSAERIAVFLPLLDEMVMEGAVTIEQVHLVRYRRDIDQTAEINAEDEIPLDTVEPAEVADKAPKAPHAFANFTDRAHQIVTAARETAASSRRVHADSVDVLLAMLCEVRGIAANALRALGIDCKVVERSLRETVSRDESGASYLRSLTNKANSAAKWLEDDYTGAEHLLLALCQIRPSAATDLISRLGVQPRDICQETLNVIGREGEWQRWMADHPEL
jgi:PII-like signaling protein